MNYKMIGRILTQILLVEAVLMAPSVIWCIIDREPQIIRAFAASIALTLAAAGVLWLACRKAQRGFYAREGFVCVGVSWIALSLMGCLPFYLSQEIPRFEDALFEIVSGFTTTGASILPAVEGMPRGLLFWRSFSHWLGGMGVLVFLLAIVSAGRSPGFTLHLLRAESPGPDVGKLVPRTRQTASLMYLIYIILTVINLIFLLAGGMPLFDALCTVFGTAGTGGFGIRNDSMGSYSPYIQNVCTVFMLLFGVNFTLHYMIVLRRLRAVALDEELRLYLGAVIGCTALIAWNIRSLYPTAGETIRHAAFQVASIITTTGFSTTDFDRWPVFSKTILLGLMVVGACAGSTGGGFKCGRILLAVKNMARSIRQQLYPQRVQVVRINRQVVGERVLGNVSAFLTAYALILAGSVLIVSLDGFSVETNLSAVLACFNNIGPGLDQVGPMCSFAGYGTVSKLVLIFDMLAGRLEIFPILALMAGSTWRKR